MQEESSLKDPYLSISGADLQVWLGEGHLQDELSLAANGVTGVRTDYHTSLPLVLTVDCLGRRH